MISVLKRFRTMSSVRKRRTAVVWLAVLLFALAPAVSALCALDAPAVASPGTGVGQVASPLEDSGGHDDQASCAILSAPVIEASKTVGARFAGPVKPAGAPVAAGPDAGPRVFFAARRLAHGSTPPPEPVSRRFPRLLI
jgi:hypothetical protein